jgi:hypothetical protein
VQSICTLRWKKECLLPQLNHSVSHGTTFRTGVTSIYFFQVFSISLHITLNHTRNLSFPPFERLRLCYVVMTYLHKDRKQS